MEKEYMTVLDIEMETLKRLDKVLPELDLGIAYDIQPINNDTVLIKTYNNDSKPSRTFRFVYTEMETNNNDTYKVWSLMGIVGIDGEQDIF